MKILNLITLLILSTPIVWGDEDFLSKAKLEDLALRNYQRVFEDAGIPRNDFKTKEETVLPPSYMIDLYYQYTEEKQSKLSGNMTLTVKCIMSKIKRNTLVFDLISLLPNENISNAELHIYQRKFLRKKKPRIKYSLTNSLLMGSNGTKKYLSGTTKIIPTKGWVVLDVTNIILASLHKWQSFVASIEGLMPEFGSEKQKYYMLPLDEVVRLGFKPFLIIYSQNITGFPPSYDQSSRTSATSFKKEYNSPLHTYADALKLSDRISPYSIHQEDDDKLDNEIPSIPIDYQNPSLPVLFNLQKGTSQQESIYTIFDDYGIFNGTLDPSETQNIISRRDSRIVRKRSAAFDTDNIDKSESLPYRFSTPGPSDDFLFSSDSFLPISRIWWNSKKQAQKKIFKKPTNKRSKKSKRNKSNYNRITDFNNVKMDSPTVASEIGSCAIREVIVSNLYWSNQIIAPSSFAFNYCSGTCYSNSQRFGSIYNSVNCVQKLRPNTEFQYSQQSKDNYSHGTSCCIPKEKKRLSILFVDKHNTVVLKSYPNAIVTSCSCE